MVFIKQRASFIKRWRIEWILLSEPNKNVNVKHIESYKSREGYQADIVFSLRLWVILIKKYLYNDGSFHKVCIGNSITVLPFV